MNVLTLCQRVGALLALTLLCNCSEQEVVAELRSLSGSEDAVFVCRDEAGLGHPYSDCPDRNTTDDTNAAKKLSVYALVSQTVTDEIAVVDVTRGKVVDVDPARPGFGFLRVGGRPISMAATPGGRATFVATGDVGRNGIFALPTSCLDAPESGQVERDLTTWPACRLDETPGEISVMIEPFADADPQLSSNTLPGDQKCRNDAYGDADAPSSGNTCQADLRDEGGGEGRRKLVVALPDSGQLAIIDAQELLNLPAGTFPRCPIEARVNLQVDVPQGVAQVLPADLTGNLLEPGMACSEVAMPMAPTPAKRFPQPAGIAVSDNRLYVADQAAPVVHVLDTSSVCGMTELPPLLPQSLREPGRVVTTRRVAVSPLTPAGQRFAYAIDAEDQPGASVMVFDVSPGSTDRTPLVRSGSPELPNEKPDRLAIGSSARDVTFAYRDIPYVDPATGVAQFGTACNPDTTADAASPGALARTSLDFSTGARPGLLRGLFGFILLTNGAIAIVDVDDFDAACRRPVSTNTDPVPDFRGCANDLSSEPFSVATNDGGTNEYLGNKRFVTGEVSCRVVQPHRFRSSRFALNDSSVGVRAPSLRDFPRLSVPASVAAGDPTNRPRLLAVPFVGSKGATIVSEVFVGSTRYTTAASGGDDAIATSPNDRSSEVLQTQNTVILPPLEPRSYAAEDTVTVTYEGSYAGERASGLLQLKGNELRLEDASLSFCGAGVYDIATMKAYAMAELGVADAAQADVFAGEHADYVQLTTALPSETDTYWKELAADKTNPTRDTCLGLFGAQDVEPLLAARDFRVEAAFADHLLLTPRLAGDVTPELVTKCFPTAQKYRLRTGKHWALVHSAFGFRHDVVAKGDKNQCVRSCDPLRKWSRGRVFEISSVNEQDHCRAADDPGEPLDLRVGCATDLDVACVYDQAPDAATRPGVAPSDAAAACVFNGLNDRFALYRGRLPSERDSVFTWRTTGGFTPLVMSLTSATSSSVVAPQSIQFLQQPEQMAVVDGASQGLSLFSLDTFGIVKPSPFY
ncbi:MAG TPA: hypothetical protein VHP33_20920 [Polyangiaceae bacterium]|nr:hypothetical protein [Polyangiaceae bacterium]